MHALTIYCTIDNMVFVLFFMLLALDLLFFILFDRNVLSPSVIGTSVFAFSTFIAILSIDEWKFKLSAYTVVIIISSLMVMGTGEFLARLLFIGKRKYKTVSMVSKEPIEVSAFLIIIMSAVFSLLFLRYYNALMRIAVAAGYKKNQGLLFVAYVRAASLQSEKYGRIDRLSGYSRTFVGCIGYIFMYIIIYNKIFFNKIKPLHILPVIVHLPYSVISGGRTSFIYEIAFCLIIGGTFYFQKNGMKMRYTLRVVRAGAIGLLVFFVIFIMVGSLKSSTITQKAWHTIAFYTGMSIPSLDDYMLNPRPEGEYFGENTLFGIYGFLRKFDNTIPSFYAPYDFVSFNGTRGNVYTIIRRYHQDYGFIGLYFMMFFLGIFYTVFYLLVCNKSGFSLIVYASIIRPIVEMSIEERFFMSVVSTGQIISIVIYGIFYLCLCRSNFKRSITKLLKPHFSRNP